MKKKKDAKLLKIATNIRVTRYELGRARANAARLQMRLSDYFNMVLHDVNDRFEKAGGFEWKSQLVSASRS